MNLSPNFNTLSALINLFYSGSPILLAHQYILMGTLTPMALCAPLSLSPTYHYASSCSYWMEHLLSWVAFSESQALRERPTHSCKYFSPVVKMFSCMLTVYTVLFSVIDPPKVRQNDSAIAAEGLGIPRQAEQNLFE